jgi:hypothetical protein
MPAAKTAEPTEIHFTAPPISTTTEGANVPAVQPESSPLQPLETATILQVIARVASDPAADINKMERLIAMQERMQAAQDRREFDNAMVSAQEEMKAIRADMSNPQTRSNYASYAALDKAIRPIYARHGFAVSFNTGDAPKADDLRVLATVSHRSGHRQEYRIDMPADGKGARGGDVMTRTHATGAAASYGQRYLYKLIFNLAVGDVDDDGNGAGSMAEEDDVEALAPKDAPRDAHGKLLSQYSAMAAAKAKDWADGAIQCINHGNAQQAQEWLREAQTVPKGKKKSPLDWLRDNSPGQYTRVRQAYQNVTGEDLE